MAGEFGYTHAALEAGWGVCPLTTGVAGRSRRKEVVHVVVS